MRTSPDGRGPAASADVVPVRPVGKDPVMTQQGTEVPERRSTDMVSPLPGVRWCDRGAKVWIGDLEDLQRGDR